MALRFARPGLTKETIVDTKTSILLDLIASVEAPLGYNTVYGNNQRKLPKVLTEMTLNQVIGNGPKWSKDFGSSAAGRYQFMRATLMGLKKELNLTGAEIFNPALQDRLAVMLLNRRGYSKFLEGRLSLVEFGLGLAREWASFPVLAETSGAKRQVMRGQSYYAGDGKNKSLLKPEKVEQVLAQVRTVEHMPAPIPVSAVGEKPVSHLFNPLEGVQNMINAKFTDYLIALVTSKINIWAAAMAAVIIAFINTKFGLNLGVKETAAITTLLVTVMGVGVALLRTFLNRPKIIKGKLVATLLKQNL